MGARGTAEAEYQIFTCPHQRGSLSAIGR